MLHHDVSYDPTLLHLDLNGKVNNKGVYHHFVTGNNMSTLHCYQVRKKGEARNDHTLKTGCFWSNRLCNSFTHKLGLEGQFEISDEKIDTKHDRTKNISIKEGSNYGNGQVDKPDVETVVLSEDNPLQGFVS